MRWRRRGWSQRWLGAKTPRIRYCDDNWASNLTYLGYHMRSVCYAKATYYGMGFPPNFGGVTIFLFAALAPWPVFLQKAVCPALRARMEQEKNAILEMKVWREALNLDWREYITTHSFRDSPQPTVPFGLLIIPSHTTTTYQRHPHPPPPTPYVAVASAATEVERKVERSRMRCGK